MVLVLYSNQIKRSTGTFPVLLLKERSFNKSIVALLNDFSLPFTTKKVTDSLAL